MDAIVARTTVRNTVECGLAEELFDKSWGRQKMNPTKEEAAAIRSLKRIAKKWPDTLWLFSANGTLCVMKKNDLGERAMLSTDGVDPDYLVDSVDIPNDGGDW